MSEFEQCRRCGRAMRPAGVSAAQAPGTRSHGARGYCGGCYGTMRKNGELERVQHPRAVAGEPVDVPDTACVLVRIDLTPATYKTLTRAGLNIGAELSKYATRMALKIEANHA